MTEIDLKNTIVQEREVESSSGDVVKLQSLTDADAYVRAQGSVKTHAGVRTPMQDAQYENIGKLKKVIDLPQTAGVSNYSHRESRSAHTLRAERIARMAKKAA